MKQGYATMRCGLIGEHLSHSFSAPIHRSLADYSYTLQELPPESVGDFVRSGALDAFNVTIPYKKTVMEFLDRVSEEARRIGAVNTVVRRPDGSLDGYNTDYYGFDRMLTDSGIDVQGAKVLVLGNGGASLTVRCVLADRGASEIVVLGRAECHTEEVLLSHRDAHVIVNATPVGMYPGNGEALFSLGDFPHCRGVLDLIYNPARTALLLDAERRGIPHCNGLSMLVAQAARAFELFTGDSCEEDAIRRITAEISQSTENIILVGMPGCGKSTVGRALAKELNRPFFDADDAFTSTYRRTPASVIAEDGEDRFRSMETEILRELCKQSGAVIACGGGAVTREENYPLLHQNGVIVYLRRELSRLALNGRPISLRTSPEELFEKRRAAYERFADLTVDNTEALDGTVRALTDALQRRHH